jgi:hypothetical protein
MVDFVEGAAQAMPPHERVAVFDNDGTLWCEKPMPIELGFILRRLAEMAEADESLRERQPWKAAHERDHAWLGGVITKHYAGDDSDVKVLMAGILQAFAGQTVEEYAAAAAPPFSTRHPTPRSGGVFATAATCRCSSCCTTSRHTASRASLPRAAAATSCGW